MQSGHGDIMEFDHGYFRGNPVEHSAQMPPDGRPSLAHLGGGLLTGLSGNHFAAAKGLSFHTSCISMIVGSNRSHIYLMKLSLLGV